MQPRLRNTASGPQFNWAERDLQTKAARKKEGREGMREEDREGCHMILNLQNQHLKKKNKQLLAKPHVRS